MNISTRRAIHRLRKFGFCTQAIAADMRIHESEVLKALATEPPLPKQKLGVGYVRPCRKCGVTSQLWIKVEKKTREGREFKYRMICRGCDRQSDLCDTRQQCRNSWNEKNE